MSIKNILILEDDIEFANTLAESLREAGHNITVINEVRSLLSSIRDNAINFILSDIMLEESMGTDILKLLNHRNSNVPIVFMTGFDGIPGLSNALGDKLVIDVLIKPFKISSLLNLINNY